jgi:hypothetical protein
VSVNLLLITLGTILKNSPKNAFMDHRQESLGSIDPEMKAGKIYALWQGLSAELSIARYSFNPVSGANRRIGYRSVVLNYQDARGLLTP